MEMLSEEYWKLLKGLSQRCLHTIASYGGIFVKLNESGFMAYFISDAGDVPDPLGAINCSLEIKASIMELGREWKIRKDWFHHIELNMGLHWEEGYVGTLSTSAGDLLTSFGAGQQMVTTMSRLAKNGEIWASKTVIDKIPPEKRKRLRFGVQRHESSGHPIHPGYPGYHRYIRNGFARMKDIFGAAASKLIHDESLDLLPITQIFDLEAGMPL
jgi:class 3 adenylate cyclase